MKKLLFIISIILFIYIIYELNVDNKIYYFNIMEKKYEFETYNDLLNKNIKNKEKYVNYYENDYRVTDLIRNINDNKKIGKKNIQNILIKADLITLKIGNNELVYKINNSDISELYEYINSLTDDIDELFKLIRKYSKEKIYFIGFYNNNDYYSEIYSYLILRIKDLCNYYNIEYIDVKNEFNKEENVNIYNKIKKKY